MTPAQYEKHWLREINDHRCRKCGAQCELVQRVRWKPGVTASFWRCPRNSTEGHVSCKRGAR